jgi:hypothetical protein
MSATTLIYDENISQVLKYYNAQYPNVTYRQAGQLFCVDPTILYRHGNTNQQSVSTNGGSNQILDAIQREAILRYVKDQHVVGLSCSTPMILSTIRYLCDQDNLPWPHPSIGYVKTFIKSLLELYKVKYKPLDYKRWAVQDIEAVQEWYKEYTNILERYCKDNMVAGVMVTVLVLTRVTFLQSGPKPLKRVGRNNQHSGLSMWPATTTGL